MERSIPFLPGFGTYRNTSGALPGSHRISMQCLGSLNVWPLCVYYCTTLAKQLQTDHPSHPIFPPYVLSLHVVSSMTLVVIQPSPYPLGPFAKCWLRKGPAWSGVQALEPKMEFGLVLLDRMMQKSLSPGSLSACKLSALDKLPQACFL